jgi:hypothetical protein
MQRNILFNGENRRFCWGFRARTGRTAKKYWRTRRCSAGFQGVLAGPPGARQLPRIRRFPQWLPALLRRLGRGRGHRDEWPAAGFGPNTGPRARADKPRSAGELPGTCSKQEHPGAWAHVTRLIFTGTPWNQKRAWPRHPRSSILAGTKRSSHHGQLSSEVLCARCRNS